MNKRNNLELLIMYLCLMFYLEYKGLCIVVYKMVFSNDYSQLINYPLPSWKTRITANGGITCVFPMFGGRFLTHDLQVPIGQLRSHLVHVTIQWFVITAIGLFVQKRSEIEIRKIEYGPLYLANFRQYNYSYFIQEQTKDK